MIANQSLTRRTKVRKTCNSRAPKIAKLQGEPLVQSNLYKKLRLPSLVHLPVNGKVNPKVECSSSVRRFVFQAWSPCALSCLPFALVWSPVCVPWPPMASSGPTWSPVVTSCLLWRAVVSSHSHPLPPVATISLQEPDLLTHTRIQIQS